MTDKDIQKRSYYCIMADEVVAPVETADGDKVAAACNVDQNLTAISSSATVEAG